MSTLGELRYQATGRRVRALRDGVVVADTDNAILVLEPRRVVGQYAFPVAHVHAELAADDSAPAVEHALGLDGRSILDPSTGFGFHTAPGQTLSVGGVAGAGFRFAEDPLRDVVALDFDAFEWLEEAEPLFGHPRDPMHRIDVRISDKTVTVALGGDVVAESSRPLVLFEGLLPPRYYLPPADVHVDLVRSETATTCAYKGHATHWSIGDHADVAWSYPEPARELSMIAGLVSFYQERTDVTVDGKPLGRPQTPWS